MLEVECSQKPLLAAIETGEGRLDEAAGTQGVGQRGIDYPTEIVHRPDGHLVQPDDLLACKINAAEIAVEITPFAADMADVVRAAPARRSGFAAANIGSRLGFDDKFIEPQQIQYPLLHPPREAGTAHLGCREHKENIADNMTIKPAIGGLNHT
jgi:hypothetical protein